ncbi:hypothetical protein B0J18DRAFT_196793 [Chaetomium sp. MPI-SDFR-AT-0129]|nr:hypothetical protein B0J18DRAFT_196793 [Chaetomium sp. MPI-SDFR-AT-0129]
MTSTTFAGRPWAFPPDYQFSASGQQPPLAGPLEKAHNISGAQQSQHPQHSQPPQQHHQHPPIFRQPPQAHDTRSDIIINTHRQNHNSSKLPAFRFADLQKDRIPALLALQQAAPLAPVLSQTTVADPLGASGHIPEASHNIRTLQTLHHSSSTPTLPDRPAPLPTPATTFEFQQHHAGGASATASTSASVTTKTTTKPRARTFQLPGFDIARDNTPTGSKRPASFSDTHILPRDASAANRRLSQPQQPSQSQYQHQHQYQEQEQQGRPTSATSPIPPIKRRLTESAIKQSSHGHRDSAKSDVKQSRPPLSHKPFTSPSGASSYSSGKRTAPRSSRSPGARKSVFLDMRAWRKPQDVHYSSSSHSSKKSKSSSSNNNNNDHSNDHRNNDGIAETGSEYHHRDRPLPSIEGGRGEDEDLPQPTPSENDEMTTTTDNDNTADLFMKIAGEDPAPRASEQLPASASAEPSPLSRISRSAHRRPLSTSVAATHHETPSPPRVTRRLSDQRDSSQSRQAADTQSAHPLSRESSAYRTPAGRENLPPLATSAESSSRSQSGRTPLRPSPVTPRQISFKDSLAGENSSSSSYQRRRQSLTDNNNHSSNNSSNPSSSRSTHYRNANLVITSARTYHSSPLVPKSVNVLPDHPNNPDANQAAAEGNESSSSTAAPSTVWDELDDLKSRIHRLELTGKMPATSGGNGANGVSRSSEERPRTATTNATTVSASPKRGSGTGVPQTAEAPQNNVGNINSSVQHIQQTHMHSSPLARETQPLLLSALSKTKNLVNPDVFDAIESAAADAITLSSMIGSVGQPGPVSSAASVVGGYNGSVTDRQLRKKADSICRSLTELCLALADPAGRTKLPLPAPPPAAAPAAAPEPETITISPAINHLVAETPNNNHRRPSAVADAIVKNGAAGAGSTNPSPRAPTSLEQKRKSMLAGMSSLSSPRYATAPSTPLESTAGRKSSLLLARIRRTATDEPEESPQSAGGVGNSGGRRSSLLLRSRRLGSEEPEDQTLQQTQQQQPSPRESGGGRKTSLHLRTRKAMVMSEDEDDGPTRIRAPSRAVTEVNGFRRETHRESHREPPISGSHRHHRQQHDSGSENNRHSPEGPATPSVLPRRSRLVPAAIATRLATALPSSQHHHQHPSTPARKYLERSSTTQERDRDRDRDQDRTRDRDRDRDRDRERDREGRERDRERALQNLSDRLAEERGHQQQRQVSGSAGLGLGLGLLGRSGKYGEREGDGDSEFEAVIMRVKLWGHATLPWMLRLHASTTHA